MKKIRQHNDIDISITLREADTGNIIDTASCSNIDIKLQTAGKKVTITEFTKADDGQIHFRFNAEDQTRIGIYSIIISATLNDDRVFTTDICNAFALVNCSCEVGGEGEVKIETLDLTAEFATIDEKRIEAIEKGITNLEEKHTEEIDAVNGEITKIKDGTTTVGKATNANYANSATNADYATNAGRAEQATNAETAFKATQDGAGNIIANTYAKKSELSDGTITVKNAEMWDGFNYQYISATQDKPYKKLMTISLMLDYLNAPISFDINQRNAKTRSTACVRFGGEKLGSYTIVYFNYMGDSRCANLRIYNAGNSVDENGAVVAQTFEIWTIEQSSDYESFAISNIHYNQQSFDRQSISITCHSTYADTLPTYTTYVDCTLGVFDVIASSSKMLLGSSHTPVNAGNSFTPVYFKGGVPTKCNISLSGNRWDALSWIDAAGYTHLGKILAFNTTDANNIADVIVTARDANDADGAGLTIGGTTIASGKFAQYSGFVTFSADMSNTTNKYWGKLWEITEDIANNNINVTFLCKNAANSACGIINLNAYVYRNGNTTNGYTFDNGVYYAQVLGNLNIDDFRLYVIYEQDSVSGVSSVHCELWVNGQGTWQGYNAVILSSTTRASVEDISRKGIFNQSVYSTEQTPPAVTPVTLVNQSLSQTAAKALVADKAAQDGNGKVIADTYANKQEALKNVGLGISLDADKATISVDGQFADNSDYQNTSTQVIPAATTSKAGLMSTNDKYKVGRFKKEYVVDGNNTYYKIASIKITDANFKVPLSFFVQGSAGTIQPAIVTVKFSNTTLANTAVLNFEYVGSTQVGSYLSILQMEDTTTDDGTVTAKNFEIWAEKSETWASYRTYPLTQNSFITFHDGVATDTLPTAVATTACTLGSWDSNIPLVTTSANGLISSDMLRKIDNIQLGANSIPIIQMLQEDSVNQFLIPYMQNDIAYPIARGGYIKMWKDGVESALTDTICNGLPDFVNVRTTSVSEIVIEIDTNKALPYGQTIYLAFSRSSWRAKSIKLETKVAATDEWIVAKDVTDFSGSIFSSNLPTGDNTSYRYLRFTLSNFNSYDCRISDIGVASYDSKGLQNIVLPLGGGSMYGSITPYTDVAYDLGSSSKKWKNVYANMLTSKGADVTGNVTLNNKSVGELSSVIWKNFRTAETNDWANTIFSFKNANEDTYWRLGEFGRPKGFQYMYFGKNGYNGENFRFYDNGQFKIPAAEGLAPLVVSSKTMVANLKAQYATQDDSGNNIAETYAIKTDVTALQTEIENLKKTVQEQAALIEALQSALT